MCQLWEEIPNAAAKIKICSERRLNTLARLVLLSAETGEGNAIVDQDVQQIILGLRPAIREAISELIASEVEAPEVGRDNPTAVDEDVTVADA